MIRGLVKVGLEFLYLVVVTIAAEVLLGRLVLWKDVKVLIIKILDKFRVGDEKLVTIDTETLLGSLVLC